MGYALVSRVCFHAVEGCSKFNAHRLCWSLWLGLPWREALSCKLLFFQPGSRAFGRLGIMLAFA